MEFRFERAMCGLRNSVPARSRLCGRRREFAGDTLHRLIYQAVFCCPDRCGCMAAPATDRGGQAHRIADVEYRWSTGSTAYLYDPFSAKGHFSPNARLYQGAQRRYPSTGSRSERPERLLRPSARNRVRSQQPAYLIEPGKTMRTVTK